MELIIIKLIVNKPLNPSIKFAPFIINKKHKSTKNNEKILFSIHEFKNIKSILYISIGIKIIEMTKKIIINNNRTLGLIFILISSKYPTKNKLEQRKIY